MKQSMKCVIECWDVACIFACLSDCLFDRMFVCLFVYLFAFQSVGVSLRFQHGGDMGGSQRAPGALGMTTLRRVH